MLVLNTSVQNRHILKFTRLIDVSNYWNWGDKRKVMHKEKILVGLIQFKV